MKVGFYTLNLDTEEPKKIAEVEVNGDQINWTMPNAHIQADLPVGDVDALDGPFDPKNPAHYEALPLMYHSYACWAQIEGENVPTPN